MLDEKDLQAIRSMMKEEISAAEDRIDAKMDAMENRIDAKMDAKLADTKKEIMQGVTVLMEQEFRPQFRLLAEGQQLINEKLDALADEVRDHDARISALEIMVHKGK